MKYRPEIDGLRSVAVLPVIAFHAGFGFASGGYVGVDVFFVISGYLITTILLADIDARRFSLLRFYERRARRILPALFTVMTACFALGWVWMMQSQFLDLAEAMAATTLFISNILYWTEAGYFAAAAEENPLLHTWSLAVEEQYYLAFPPLLTLLMWAGRRAALITVAAAAALSLALALLGPADQSAKFFLTHYRIWELLAGSLCAFALAPHGPWASDALAGLGLALIAASMVLMDAATPFPHFGLPPVLGTVLIVLFAAPGTYVARLLSLRVLVGIGLISFSAYLWHQPLFAFARIRAVFAPDPWLMAALAALSLLLAWATWALIEQPFRGAQPRALPRRWHVFTASGAGMLALLLATLYVGETDGAPARGVAARVVPPLMDARAERFETWAVLERRRPARVDLDRFDPGGPPVRLLIIGDSHSKGLFNALYETPEAHPQVQVRWVGLAFDCTPGAEAEVVSSCLDAQIAASRTLFDAASHVLIAARWSSAPKLAALPGYLATLGGLDAALLVAGTTQEYRFDAPDMILQVVRDTGFDGTGAFPVEVAERMFWENRVPGLDETDAALRRVAEAAGAGFLDRRALACESAAARCTAVTPDMQGVIYDYGHWTLPGARHFGREMAARDWLGLGDWTPPPRP